MTEEERKRLYKEAMKEAFSEWLDTKFAVFGKWSIIGLAAILFLKVIEYVAAKGWLHT
jgi:hypothetical protein